MFAKLSALVGGGPALNYNVDPQQYDQAWGCWTHHSGTFREDGSPVSVFRIQAADANDQKLVAARNGVRRLKMVSFVAFRTRNNLRTCLHLKCSWLEHAVAAPVSATALDGQHAVL